MIMSETPLVYLKTRLGQFRIVCYCVILVCGLFKTLPLCKYFPCVFTFVLASIPPSLIEVLKSRRAERVRNQPL